ncbi:unnamed protein product [Schistocephalus solidus]|uniref:AA_permease_C domain-containing protein n=1 Tax=Schistocephalus solidus TaxID=70667 RepID=A0A183SI65_SCHSO|nr:unnamed protein product [Schistocephalus solidus]
MIGGTIFVLTGTVARAKTGPAVFLAYIIAGIVALFNALNYSELACRFPKAGSTYTYAYIMLGELPAFLAGWSILLEYILGVAAVSRGWSSNLNGLVNDAISNWTIENVGLWSEPNGFFASYPDFVALAIILFVSVITCFGIEKSSILNFVCTIVNTGILFAISAFMFVYAKPDLIVAVPPVNATATPGSLAPDDLTPFLPYGIVGLVAGTATCFNAFIGFDMISTCAEEAAEPEKSIPRANTLSVLIVTVLLSLASLSLVLYIPWYEFDLGAPFLKALAGPLSGGGDNLAKRILFYVVGVGCLIALFSNILTSSIAAPRILYAMGQDGLLFHCLAKISDPFKSPVAATSFIALVAAILTLAFTIESLADFLSLGTLIAYSMTAIGVIFIRYCPPPELREDNTFRGGMPNADMNRPVDPSTAKQPKLPMVPFMPFCTIVINSVLIAELSWMTWVRFLIWVAIGECL